MTFKLWESRRLTDSIPHGMKCCIFTGQLTQSVQLRGVSRCCVRILMRNQQRVCINATKVKRYDVKECASRGVYLMDDLIYIFFDKYHTKNHMDIPKSIGTCVMLLWTISFDLFREKWKLIKRKKQSVPKVNDQQHTFNTLFPTACTYFVFF